MTLLLSGRSQWKEALDFGVKRRRGDLLGGVSSPPPSRGCRVWQDPESEENANVMMMMMMKAGL